MAENTTNSGTTRNSQLSAETGDSHGPDPHKSPSTTLAGRLANVIAGLTLWDGLITLSVVIASAALILHWQRGLLIECFRQGEPFDRFALVLIFLVFLPQQFERFRLPGMLGLILGGVLIGPHGLALAPKLGPVGQFFSEMGRVFLMFICGLEISLSDFRRYAKPSTL